MRCNGSNWAVYSPGSWDGFRNDVWALWAGVIMRLEHHLVGGYVRYISPHIIIIIIIYALDGIECPCVECRHIYYSSAFHKLNIGVEWPEIHFSIPAWSVTGGRGPFLCARRPMQHEDTLGGRCHYVFQLQINPSGCKSYWGSQCSPWRASSHSQYLLP